MPKTKGKETKLQYVGCHRASVNQVLSVVQHNAGTAWLLEH